LADFDQVGIIFDVAFQIGDFTFQIGNLFGKGGLDFGVVGVILGLGVFVLFLQFVQKVDDLVNDVVGGGGFQLDLDGLNQVSSEFLSL